ncbi:MAG: hypothetical protein IJR49_00690, partial [Treponema sp.]|nr:hypothetical protein [Treponema sp.]
MKARIGELYVMRRSSFIHSFIIISTLCLASCSGLTWNQGLREFLDKQTNKIFVKNDYSISGHHVLHNGKIYLNCNEDQTLTFNIRNPQGKVFESDLEIEGLTEAEMNSVTTTETAQSVSVKIPSTVLS